MLRTGYTKRQHTEIFVRSRKVQPPVAFVLDFFFILNFPHYGD